MATRTVSASAFGRTPGVSCQVKVVSSTSMAMAFGESCSRRTATHRGRRHNGAAAASVVDLVAGQAIEAGEAGLADPSASKQTGEFGVQKGPHWPWN